MAFKSAMLLVILFIAAISAQSVVVSVPPGTNAIPVGVWSEWYTITANDNSQFTFTLTLANLNIDPDVENTVEFSSNTFQFAGAQRTQSFRVKSNRVQDAALEFTSNYDTAFPFTTQVSFSFENRSIEVESFGTSDKVGVQSEPVQIVLSYPSTAALTLTPSVENNTLSFTPSSIVIPAGQRSGEFTWASSIYGSYNWEITWSVTGSEVPFYDTQALNGFYPVSVAQKVWAVSVTSNKPDLLVGGVDGQNSNSFYVSATNNVTGNIRVTPQGADLRFTPAFVDLTSQNKHAIFNITALNPNVLVSRTVNIYSSGDVTQYAYTTALPSIVTSVSIPKRSVSVHQSASVLTINNITYISISIPAPTNNALTVTLSAANLVFNTSATTNNAWANSVTVEFTAASRTTSIVVAALGQFLGNDYVWFVIGGADVELYNEVNPISYTVEQATFITPSTYNGFGSFWVGVESADIPIRVSISPIDWVSVKLFAPNAKITPSEIRFRNGTEQQYFRITPWYLNTDTDDSNSFTTTVEYLIDGPNYNHYSAIAPSVITVNQRRFQSAWSAHTTTDDSSTSVYRLHKTYKVWGSLNYIAKGEQVTVTPVSPYFSFSPKVLNFHGSSNRILFEATVTGIPPSGSVSIDYIIGGRDGGLYAPASVDTVSVGLRPLRIVGAVVSTDERVSEKKSILLTDRYFINPSNNEAERYTFSTSVLSSYHVNSFMIRSFALPDRDLTITPVSPHVKFSPSKITLKASNAVKRLDYTAWTSNSISVPTQLVAGGSGDGVTYVFNATGVYAEANFTVEAYAAGVHQVTFELSGSDKDYYVRLAPQNMRFNLVMRPDSEPFKAVLSSSSSLFPSFVVVAIIAAFALVL